MIIAATGSGKTELASSVISDALSRGRKIAFIVHRDNLVRQTLARFEKYDLNPAAIKSGFPEDLKNPVQVVSIQTLHRRPHAISALEDIVIWDEAHLTPWTSFSKDKVLNSNIGNIHIGLTASSWRLSKKRNG